MIKKILVFVMFLFFSFCSYSKEKSNSKEHFFVKHLDYAEGSIFFHSISLPFESSNKIIAFNRLPGFSFSLGKRINNIDKKTALYYQLGFLAYHQKDLHYGYELKNNILASINVLRKAYLTSGLGLSYLHTFEDAPLYKLDKNGYKKVVDLGRAQVMLSGLLGIGVRVFKKIDIITSYQLALQMPFAKKAGVFFMPHNRVFVGSKINF